MASRNDPEAGPIADERAPLLSHDQTQDDATAPSHDDDLSPPLQPPSRWRLVWVSLSIILGAGLIALFVKGWIDADDVDVSSMIIAYAL